jgi:hypothetical protein
MHRLLNLIDSVSILTGYEEQNLVIEKRISWVWVKHFSGESQDFLDEEIGDLPGAIGLAALHARQG